jgi:plasmid stabilization system protein ParE
LNAALWVRLVRRADLLTIKNSCSSHHRLGFRPGVSTYNAVQICEATSIYPAKASLIFRELLFRRTEPLLPDLTRLYAFLAVANPSAAARTVQLLTTAPDSLLTNPRVGKRLEEFDPRVVRRVIVGQYELRYEVAASTVTVLRLWHTREDR